MSGKPSAETIRATVRARYAGAVGKAGPTAAPAAEAGCCGRDSPDPCCDSGDCGSSVYSAEDRAKLPSGADLGLGCGNPGALADLRPGELVVDLGSGAGVDCFLAAHRVGPSGRAIGVDMTPEMVAKARELARSSDLPNVEFRLGEIEHLPVADSSVDVVISNCVINLAVDKRQVYREVFRVLKPGGRLVVADVLATRPIPPELRADTERWSSCSSGALTVAETETILRDAGFAQVEVILSELPQAMDSLQGQADLGVVPATVRAAKP